MERRLPISTHGAQRVTILAGQAVRRNCYRDRGSRVRTLTHRPPWPHTDVPEDCARPRYSDSNTVASQQIRDVSVCIVWQEMAGRSLVTLIVQ